jgi:hypothetical protein
VPKTYNSRQRFFLRLEAEHAPDEPEGPDLLRYVRGFSIEEVQSIIDRVERLVATGKVTQLRPETAYLVARALKAWNAEPSRENIVREICGVRDGCDDVMKCMECVGKANAIMHLYRGMISARQKRGGKKTSSLNV